MWDKVQSGNFSCFELAWTSFDRICPPIFIKCSKGGFLQKMDDTKIHPTQKPTSLYCDLLKRFAKKDDKILDTHLGSGSIAIAVDKINRIEKLNLTLTASEIEKEYFDACIKRFNNFKAQIKINFVE